MWTHYSSFERTILYINFVKNFLSDYSTKGTPVPIPNTEVKLGYADDSIYAKIRRR